MEVTGSQALKDHKHLKHQRKKILSSDDFEREKTANMHRDFGKCSTCGVKGAGKHECLNMMAHSLHNDLQKLDSQLEDRMVCYRRDCLPIIKSSIYATVPKYQGFYRK